MKSAYVSLHALKNTKIPNKTMFSHPAALTLLKILALSAFTAFGATAPQSGSTSTAPQPSTPTWTTDPTIAFAVFKIPGCAAQGQEHVEEHASTVNGKCISLEWARSIAYNAAFNHTRCNAKFFSDAACSPDKEIVTPPLYSTTLIDGYYPGCWDDISGLNTWGRTFYDDLVPSVNLTVICL